MRELSTPILCTGPLDFPTLIDGFVPSPEPLRWRDGVEGLSRSGHGWYPRKVSDDSGEQEVRSRSTLPHSINRFADFGHEFIALLRNRLRSFRGRFRIGWDGHPTGALP